LKRARTDGARDEEAGAGMEQEGPRRAVVVAREVDHRSMLLPWQHLLAYISRSGRDIDCWIWARLAGWSWGYGFRLGLLILRRHGEATGTGSQVGSGGGEGDGEGSAKEKHDWWA
jgi:hypothetical protein